MSVWPSPYHPGIHALVGLLAAQFLILCRPRIWPVQWKYVALEPEGVLSQRQLVAFPVLALPCLVQPQVAHDT